GDLAHGGYHRPHAADHPVGSVLAVARGAGKERGEGNRTDPERDEPKPAILELDRVEPDHPATMRYGKGKLESIGLNPAHYRRGLFAEAPAVMQVDSGPEDAGDLVDHEVDHPCSDEPPVPHGKAEIRVEPGGDPAPLFLVQVMDTHEPIRLEQIDRLTLDTHVNPKEVPDVGIRGNNCGNKESPDTCETNLADHHGTVAAAWPRTRVPLRVVHRSCATSAVRFRCPGMAVPETRASGRHHACAAARVPLATVETVVGPLAVGKPKRRARTLSRVLL